MARVRMDKERAITVKIGQFGAAWDVLMKVKDMVLQQAHDFKYS